jgi:hypothetical protein
VVADYRCSNYHLVFEAFALTVKPIFEELVSAISNFLGGIEGFPPTIAKHFVASSQVPQTLPVFSL